MNIKNFLNSLLVKALEKLDYDTTNAFVTYSDRPEIADFQTNVSFSLAKINKTAPFIIANSIVNELNEISSDIEITAINPGFINFKLTFNFLEKYFNNIDLNNDLLPSKINNGDTVVFDYGGANVAKQLHIGHLRSPIIGESLKRLYSLFGYKTISDTHLGDWGLQMGLVIANILEKYDCSYYFNGTGKKLNISTEELNVLYPEASLRSKEDEEFRNKAKEITVKLQNKEKGYYDIWQEIRNISVDDVKKEYDKLNANFDLWYGESNAEPYVQKVFDKLNEKKLLKLSQGAEIVEVSDETDNKPMPPIIIKSSSGAGLYATSEIATIIQRIEDFNPKEIIYITDNRQSMHFEQVFRCCKKAEIVTPNQKLTHIGIGTIKGKDGKPFKTRSGDTIKLNEIISLVTDKALEKIKANNIENTDNLALKIGISALKFGDLSNFVTKDYIFDIDKFVSFEGKTGPYILYTAVRIKSLLIKSGILGIDNYKDWNDNLLNNIKFKLKVKTEEEKQVLINILKLNDSYNVAFKELSLNSICLGLYDLCSSFSTIYNNTKILTIENKEEKESLLMLSIIVLKSIINACYVLAIDIPNKM